jgi:hypothetical protein
MKFIAENACVLANATFVSARIRSRFNCRCYFQLATR